MSGWDYRVIVVMRRIDAQAANLTVPIQLDNNTAETHTWESCRLSSNGNNPNTAFAMSTAATLAYKNWLMSLPTTYPNATNRCYVYDQDGNLTATTSAAAQASIGQPYTFNQIMSELGVTFCMADPTLPPIISNVAPNTLHVLGGAVTITGSNFQNDATVKVGLANLTNVAVSADGTTITGTVPALSVGLLGITVTNVLAGTLQTISNLLNIIL